MTDNDKTKREVLKGYFTTAVLISAGIFFVHDIVGDAAKGYESSAHIVIEALVFSAMMIALWLEIKRAIYFRRQVSVERERVARLSGELFHQIEKAFDQWRLTSSEREVAIMLIKGMSMVEIGNARSVKEKTVRQHATNVYAKAGYSNRSELTSHFIEDLLNYDSGEKTSDP